MKNYSYAIIALCLLCQGCLPAAIAYTGYKVSESREESAKTQARAADLATYAKYRTDMETINLQRQKAGLKPNPIMEQDEWRAFQTANQSVPTSTPSTTKAE
jgi:hypothetical protein